MTRRARRERKLRLCYIKLHCYSTRDFENERKRHWCYRIYIYDKMASPLKRGILIYCFVPNCRFLTPERHGSYILHTRECVVRRRVRWGGQALEKTCPAIEGGGNCGIFKGGWAGHRGGGGMPLEKIFTAIKLRCMGGGNCDMLELHPPLTVRASPR